MIVFLESNLLSDILMGPTLPVTSVYCSDVVGVTDL